jgi:hypothetical protein
MLFKVLMIAGKNPENSGLLMANDEILTIKDLFELCIPTE